MIAAIKPAGANTRGLLAYLYGPGRHDEHLDPHLVAAFTMLGVPDPGRDETATLTQLARHLDEPVRLRNSEFGKPVTDHVWHCPVRAAPEDRHLSDSDWADIAQRIVEAAGIAPPGDDLACRWIAVRHADDHIHILATTVREDGRRPRLHGSGQRAGDTCRQIETDYGLRQLNKGDRTAGRRPTQAEMHKAERLGWEQTSRAWLQDRIRSAIPHTADNEQLLAYLEAEGIAIKARRGPSGDLLGYAAGRPGDLNQHGEQIYHPGGKIAPDLTLPKLRDRLSATTPEEHPTARRNHPTTPWHQATDALDTLHHRLTPNTGIETIGETGAAPEADSRAQAHIAALGELLEATAQTAPAQHQPELRAATRAFARAQRSQIHADHQAARTLRTAARDLVHTATGPNGSALATLLAAMVWAAILTQRWHEAHHHAHQAEAAREALHHLQTAADRTLAPTLADLHQRHPGEARLRTLAQDVRNAVPDHADRILTDPNWPALATSLTDAEARGHQPRKLLHHAAEQRELDTAHHPASVLLTRIQHTGRNPAPNLRAEAARSRTTQAAALQSTSSPTITPPRQPTPSTAPGQSRPRR